MKVTAGDMDIPGRSERKHIVPARPGWWVLVDDDAVYFRTDTPVEKAGVSVSK